MSEESFEQMLEDSLKTIRTGEIVTGKVIDVKEDEIVLNIGYKSDGIIPRYEYTNEPGVDLRDVVHVGDELEAKVVKVNDGEGQVALSYKRLAADRGNKRLEEAYNNHEVLTAKVVQVLDGGLSVVVDESRVFIPASLVSDSYEKDLSKYAGQDIDFVITEFNPRRRRIIGDRKQLMQAKKAEMQKELFERIKVGDVVTGVIKNVTDFGAFVDLGGADGLLHISEMSWGRVENPRKVFKAGQEITTLIKDINGEKIALSLKFPDQNPWKDAAEKYAVGNIVTGRVARMTDFGAFVELEPGVDALLHVSQIAREHVDKPSDVLKIGQEIEAKVVDFNGDDHKISLSMKVLQPVQPKRPAPAQAETEDVDIEAVVAAQAEEAADAAVDAAVAAAVVEDLADADIESVTEAAADIAGDDIETAVERAETDIDAIETFATDDAPESADADEANVISEAIEQIDDILDEADEEIAEAEAEDEAVVEAVEEAAYDAAAEAVEAASEAVEIDAAVVDVIADAFEEALEEADENEMADEPSDKPEE